MMGLPAITLAKSRRNPVAIRLEDKKAIVAEVNETAGAALSVVLADYRGVTSGDMTALRAKARAENVRLKVVRNNLAKIASKVPSSSASILRWLVRPFWLSLWKIRVPLRAC